MKYRDPGTGTMFEDIASAKDWFCEVDCDECPFGCKNFAKNKPAEAARLMGLVEVEDSLAIEGMCCDCLEGGPCCDWSENYDCPSRKENGSCWRPFTEREAHTEKTDKPRICEVLGVEKDETFCIDCDNRGWHVGVQNRIYDRDGHEMPAEYVFHIIDNPEAVLRKPRWTEQELTDAEAIRRMFPGTWDTIMRYSDGSLALDDRDGVTLALSKDMFPSLLPGQSVDLSDICSE